MSFNLDLFEVKKESLDERDKSNVEGIHTGYTFNK